MPFKFKKQEIEDLIVITPRIFSDDRGFFLESYKESDFKTNDIKEEFIQDNHSFSKKGVLRGIHYQLPPKAQGKLIRVIKGAVLDIAVDLRKSSKTFLKWASVELSEENHKMFYIPPGFGHAFLTLTDNVHFAYKCTNEYSQEHDAGIIWNDKNININWPIKNPLLSEKDLNLPTIKNAKLFD